MREKTSVVRSIPYTRYMMERKSDPVARHSLLWSNTVNTFVENLPRVRRGDGLDDAGAKKFWVVLVTCISRRVKETSALTVHEMGRFVKGEIWQRKSPGQS
jgi:hypothetical protein